jgi:hypothetical protein
MPFDYLTESRRLQGEAQTIRHNLLKGKPILTTGGKAEVQRKYEFEAHPHTGSKLLRRDDGVTLSW